MSKPEQFEGGFLTELLEDSKANTIAIGAAAMVPLLIVSGLGRATIRTPINPAMAAKTLMRVRRSPRKSGDKINTQRGEVNSRATTCARGIRVRA